MTLKELFTIDNILKAIKFFKPEFYNKITWLVVGSGLALLAGKPLLELIIIAFIEQNYSLAITDNDAFIGLALVLFGLLYNIITVYLDKYLIQVQKNTQISKILEKDKKLFENFIEELPSKGSMEFLRTHSFYDGFKLDSLRQLFDFQYKWNNAEYEFVNEELESLRKELYENIRQFTYVNGMGSYAQRDGWFSTLPDNCMGQEWDLPEHVIVKIKEMNELADKVYQSHQDLVRLGNKIL